MYLGIDFLIDPKLRAYVIEVNVGLPGGAQEYDLTHRVRYGVPSHIFDRIEAISQRVYGKPFQDYLNGLPFIQSLKPFKIWIDGQGPFPKTFHPGLRLEDKWVQYEILKSLVPMPETMVFDPKDAGNGERFLREKGRLVLKRRLGRGGRGFRILDNPELLRHTELATGDYLLQECIDSRVDGYTFSIRSVAFGGEFVCMYANLAHRSFSNHGFLTFVSGGGSLGLEERTFVTKSFNERSWEAKIWFGFDEPDYLRHNLYEDEVAQTALRLPEHLFRSIQDDSVKIERFYETLDPSALPKACFERGRV